MPKRLKIQLANMRIADNKRNNRTNAVSKNMMQMRLVKT
jgi:hypothetical protein